MSKFHDVASQDQHAQMQMLITRMEGEIAQQMDMSVPSVVIAIQQMTASQLGMLDRALTAELLRETARLLLAELDENEFRQKIAPLMDKLIAEYERQEDVSSH